MGWNLTQSRKLATGLWDLILSLSACGPSSAPAAFLDGRGRQGRYLASPSRNDKKARPLISSLARASYAPLSLPELRRGIFKNPQNSRKPSEFEGNYETATDLMVHLPHRSRSNSLVVRSELSTCGSRLPSPETWSQNFRLWTKISHLQVWRPGFVLQSNP